MSVSTNSLIAYEPILTDKGYDVRFVHSIDTGSFVSSHWQTELEIIYLLSGELEVTLDQQSVLLSTGDIFLINSKSVHSTKCIKGNEALLLQLPYLFIEKYIPDLTSFIFNLKLQDDSLEITRQRDSLKMLLRKLFYIQQEASAESLLLFQMTLLEFLYLLFHHFRSPKSPEADKNHARNLGVLDPVFSYVRLHYQKSISIAEIAAITSFQPEYFCRFFKKNTGITFLQYLNEVRLSRIYDDLIHTDIPVGKLLELHGFTNYKLFRKMFHEKFGTTPKSIRRNKTDSPLSNQLC